MFEICEIKNDLPKTTRWHWWCKNWNTTIDGARLGTLLGDTDGARLGTLLGDTDGGVSFGTLLGDPYGAKLGTVLGDSDGAKLLTLP